MNSRHLVLAGDSIFDNDGYVYGAAGVIEQLRTTLPAHCRATKIAVDGNCIRHVDEQLNGLPADATDLIVSVGGNDARKNASLLSHVTKPDDLKGFLAQPLQDFRVEYAQMLERIEKTKLRLLVCSIYTQVPFKDPDWRRFAPLAISQFNEVITSEAKRFNIPVLPLPDVCTEEEDFSTFSPIEPSTQGGQKIVDKIVKMTLG